MFYGEEKLRQMARSILPSTAAKSARERRAQINRRSRRRARLICHEAASDAERAGERDFEDAKSRHDIRYMVRERQRADKLGHFERWAVHVTDHMGDDPSGRRAKLRKVLPDGLIGWHACSHLDSYDEFETQRVRFSFDTKKYREDRAKAREENRLTREKAVAQLKEILKDAALVERLNTRMQARHRRPVWRLGYTRDALPNTLGGQTVWGKKLLLVEKAVGAEKAPTLREGGVGSFVDQVFNANRRNWIAPPSTEIKDLLFPASEVADPTCHPEWLVSLKSFLEAWRTGALEGNEPWDYTYSYRAWWEKWRR
jgi:hypothetical protein